MCYVPELCEKDTVAEAIMHVSPNPSKQFTPWDIVINNDHHNSSIGKGKA